MEFIAKVLTKDVRDGVAPSYPFIPMVVRYPKKGKG